MDSDVIPLTQSCYRALTDKLYDKRKLAASEVDKMVRDFVLTNNTASLDQLMSVFQNMCDSSNTNVVKGGLMGIGAMAVSMGQPSVQPFSKSMINIVLACFLRTSESRIRYYACESLYNVCKSVRSAALPSFNSIWCSMAQLKADPDLNVRSGADVLDRLLQDLVVEYPQFDLPSFLPHLRERIYSDEKILKQLVITWLTHLHSLPHIDLMLFLPDLLDGLFLILADPDDVLIASCEHLLQQFLEALQNHKTASDFSNMVNILIVHVKSSSVTIQRVAVSWLKEFTNLAGHSLLPHLGSILQSVLPCLSLQEDSKKLTRENAKAISYGMMQLVRSDASSIDVSCVIDILTSHLVQARFVPTQLSILKWLHHLQEVLPDSLCKYLDKIFPVLLRLLSDPSDEVVLLNIQVLAEVCSANPAAPQEIVGSQYFDTVMNSLLDVLENTPNLLDGRGPIIVRQLCILLSPEQILSTLSRSLKKNKNFAFISRMVRQLNFILMTSAELFEMRNELKEMQSETGKALFHDLYSVWCYSPISALSLCLLTQHYRLALGIVKALGDMEITVEFLAELDGLVQLLETPIFSYLRLQLLEPWQHPELMDTLHGILMVLPQTEAFTTLKRRLDCIPSHRLFCSHQTEALGKSSSASRSSTHRRGDDKNSDALLKEFLDMSRDYRIYRKSSHSMNLLDKLS